jgi:hypothetical protein
MIRRPILAAVAATGLVLAGPSVSAQDSGGVEWDGSFIEVPAGPQAGPVHVETSFQHKPERTVQVTIEVSGAPPSAACAMPEPVFGGTGTTPTPRFAADLSFGCNGTYLVTAEAVTTNDSALFPHDEATRSGSVSVAMPAPTVTGVHADGEGRSITVSWDDMRGAAPDLSGYVVERQIDGGPYTQVASPGSSDTSFVDGDLPAEGGEATYRVSSTRPSPERNLTSQSTATQATPFIEDPTAAGDGTTGDGTTGDGTTGDGGTSDGGTAPGGGTTPGPTTGSTDPSAPGGGTGTPSGRPDTSVRAPRLGITGSFLPPLLRPSVDSIDTPEIDEGFQEELPYGESEPGDEEAVLPDDEMASLFTDGAASRGMAIPVATALVLAVWAFHLRFLARASRPVD